MTHQTVTCIALLNFVAIHTHILMAAPTHSSHINTNTQVSVSDYMPLHTGNTWMYSEPAANGFIINRTSTIGASTSFHGISVNQRNNTATYTINSTPDQWTEYLTVNANGYHVYGGWDPDESTPDPNDGQETYYNPPVKWLPGTVMLGGEYTFALGGITLAAHVESFGAVAVPAGYFVDVMKVVTTFTGPGAPYGRTSWYARDVGEIKRQGYYHDGTPMNYELRYAKVNGTEYGAQSLSSSLTVNVGTGVGYAGPLSGISLGYTLTGPQVYSGTLSLDSSGKAVISGLNPGSYTLLLTGNHWLDRNLSGIQVNGVSIVNTDIINGDADGDNKINLFDFVVLDMNFGSSDAMADLDGDGQVNLFDYVIIDQNFGALGD